MSYSVGIDLGATTCAAAVRRGDVLEPSALGEATVTMPAVALPRTDGTTIVGEAADGFSPYEPTLVARMVAARLGQPEPILVDGVPCDPLVLTGALIGATVDRVAATEGGRPDHVVVTYPLRPGDDAEAVLGEAAGRIVGPDVTMVPAPIAAVAKLAHDRPLDPDTIVTVVDFGGSTVDVTLVRRRDDAFDLVGEPASLGELGGVDLDAVVLSLVEGAIGDITSEVSNQDPVAMAALRRVRASCRGAKERLSTAHAAVVEVALPHARGRVEITREALERAIEAPLAAVVDLVLSTIDDAGMSPTDVDLVLLTGGSARIPCLAPLVWDRTGLEVVADDAPELTVALGAALFADGAGGAAPPLEPVADTAGADHMGTATLPPIVTPFDDPPVDGPADTGRIPATAGVDPLPPHAPTGFDDGMPLEHATPFDPGDRWSDTRTSVFDSAPPEAPTGADDQTTWSDAGDDEFQRLRTSDTDPFGARSGVLSSRIRDRADGDDHEDYEGGGGSFDVRLVIAGVVAAVAVVLVAGYALLAGTGSDDPAIAVADTSATTERATTSAPATTATTGPPATTEATTATTEASTTTTRSRPRPTAPTTEPPVFEPTPTVPPAPPPTPPTPPTPPPTPSPTTTTSTSTTTSTTVCPVGPPDPPPGCEGTSP